MDPVTLNIAPDLLAGAERAAAEQGLTLTAYIERLISNDLHNRGLAWDKSRIAAEMSKL